MRTLAIDCTSKKWHGRLARESHAQDARATLKNQTGAPDSLEQELENLNVSLCLAPILTPGIESMPSQEEPVRLRVLPQSFGHSVGQRPHVLRVVEDRNPLAVLVRLHAIQSL